MSDTIDEIRGGEYLRHKRPEYFYEVSKRSWHDEEIGTDKEYLGSCIAAELTHRFTDDSLGRIGESTLYPLAMKLLDTINDEDLDLISQSVRQGTDGRGMQMDEHLKKSAEIIVGRLDDETIKSVLIETLTGDVETFLPGMAEDRKSKIAEKRREKIKDSLDSSQLFEENNSDNLERSTLGDRPRVHFFPKESQEDGITKVESDDEIRYKYA